MPTDLKTNSSHLGRLEIKVPEITLQTLSYNKSENMPITSSLLGQAQSWIPINIDNWSD